MGLIDAILSFFKKAPATAAKSPTEKIAERPPEPTVIIPPQPKPVPKPAEPKVFVTKQKLAMLGADDFLSETYWKHINAAVIKYGITDPLCLTHFLAQLFHESGSLHYATELATGEAYEGRADLGNAQKGDGVKYKGRGLIQLTGRTNYLNYSNASGVNVIQDPKRLADPDLAADSAAWFWSKHDLNKYALADDILALTYRINGGFNGLEHRLKLLKRAYMVFGIEGYEARILATFGRIEKIAASETNTTKFELSLKKSMAPSRLAVLSSIAHDTAIA